MKSSSKIAAATVGLILTATAACSTATSLKYSGDGVFADLGTGASRPRYRIRFPEISLAGPGEYIFSTEGLPGVPLTFALEMADLDKHDAAVGASVRDKEWPARGEGGGYEDTRASKTWIAVRFSTDGKTVASNAGAVNDSWMLQWIPALNSGSLWHPNCRDIHFKRNRPTIITIEIKNVDAAALPMTVVPVLSGGGVELP